MGQSAKKTIVYTYVSLRSHMEIRMGLKKAQFASIVDVRSIDIDFVVVVDPKIHCVCVMFVIIIIRKAVLPNELRLYCLPSGTQHKRPLTF